MKGRVLALGTLLALFAAFLTRGAGPGPVPAPGVPVPVGPAPTAQAPPFVTPLEPARDPFRYLDEADSLRVDPAPISDPNVELPLPSTPPPLRLVGFVRRGDGLLAAMSLHGVVVTAGTGESAEGYLVLAVDEDAGVRLRGPDGAEVVLEVAQE
jgi:hypothetical protein